jgi:hypothetical protein
MQNLTVNFGGEMPRMDSHLLPNANAEAAWNTDLDGGTLQGLPTPVLLKDLSAVPGAVLKAFRLPSPVPLTDARDAWLPLPSPFSSVVRSPLANDAQANVYWTNPPGTANPGAWFSNWSDILNGVPPFNLGFTAPDPTNLISVGTAGGTAAAVTPFEDRSYLYTLVNTLGLESSPSLPSNVTAGAADGTWQLQNLPTLQPLPPVGKHYPPVLGVRIYRTVAGTTAGAFYLVYEYHFPGVQPGDTGALPPAGGIYVDPIRDVDAVLGTILQSTNWAPPLDGLDGLTALPGGMLVAFTGQTVHFCEPDRPHAWPAQYDLAVQYPIVGFGVWQQTLMVMTTGYPSTGSGNSPSNFTFSQVQTAEPCIARGSIVTDLLGTYYASQNGLIMLSYYGMQNQTQTIMSKNIWLDLFGAPFIIACRHRAQYLAINATGTGFMIDYTEARLGVVQLYPFNLCDAVWNDVFTGDAYMISGKKVYRWDDPHSAPLMYRWRSKKFVFAKPISYGAIQVHVDPSVVAVQATPYVGTALDDTTATAFDGLNLPSGTACLIRIFVEEQFEVAQIAVHDAWTRSRLPSGFVAFQWQFEVISRVPVFSVELATTMQELTNAKS